MINTAYNENKIYENIRRLDKFLNEIDELNRKLDYAFEEQPFYIQEIERVEYSFNSLMEENYYAIIAYLSAVNQHEILEIFKSKYNHILDINYQSVKTFSNEIYGEIYISEDFDGIKKILRSFQPFDQDVNKNVGIQFLENILRSTAVIIEELGNNVNNEASVYNSVKHVIRAVFQDDQSSNEPFYKMAKCYKPDILLPSLNIAIEYKYATEEQKLIRTIEDIAIDVKGYGGHHIYKIFYAVFYVAPGIWTEERFKHIWEDFHFPDNWKPIYVIGNTKI